jgi:acyl-coenzyme A thioesterase PaaI-like protein
MTSHIDHLARLRREMERPPCHVVLRPEPVAVEAESGTVVVELPEFRRVPEEPRYPGRLIAALIERIGQAAVAIHVGRTVPIINLLRDYLHVAPRTDLIAPGRVLRADRSIARADVGISDAANIFIAIGCDTYITL